MAGKPHPLNTREIEARRRNAQRSTGPRTVGGKRRVALNPITHGRYASAFLRPSPEAMSALGEDPQRFRELLIEALDSYPPQNALQARVSEEIAVLLWQLERNHQAQEGKLVRTMEKLERDRHMRLKQIRAGTSYDALQADVLETGLRRAPNSPTKFPELIACLERLARRVREHDFSDETDLKALYGSSPTFLGAGIVNAFRALAQASRHGAPDQALVDELQLMIQEEVRNVSEEYQFYCREYVEISRAMRQECGAPTYDRDYLLLRREEGHLHHLLEQKIKLLMRMQSTGSARKARPGGQDWRAWFTEGPGGEALPSPAHPESPLPKGVTLSKGKDSRQKVAALSHKIAPVEAPTMTAEEQRTKREETIRKIHEIYGLTSPPESAPSDARAGSETEGKNGTNQTLDEPEKGAI